MSRPGMGVQDRRRSRAALRRVVRGVGTFRLEIVRFAYSDSRMGEFDPSAQAPTNVEERGTVTLSGGST